MIMDEPTNNLGVPEQHKVLELIRKLRDQGVPVILITHTLPDVFAVSDRLMVMHRGRKVTEKTDRRHQHRGARAVHGRRARRHEDALAEVWHGERRYGTARGGSREMDRRFPITADGCSIRRPRSSISSSRTASTRPAASSPSTIAGKPIGRNVATGLPPPREIHVTTRMVHCFAIARLMGRPGADRFIDHGMEFLWNGHRDAQHGGYFWGIGEDGPSDPLKQAYGHAFVLLAASSAKVVGHPDADRLIADIGEVLAHALLGVEARRGAPRSSPPTGSRSAAIAARTPTCI